MPALHALLISIDTYPSPAHRLWHAVSDAQKLGAHLRLRLRPGVRLRLEELSNQEATKANVIRAFDHFAAAGEEDVCLLYFSGHGSTVRQPPRELAHLERVFQSIVCYDSRRPGGADLTDKELSYLIWSATGGKRFRAGGHFVAIMDCCHAGDNSRTDEEAPLYRTIEPAFSANISAYHGYSATKSGAYPPRAPHVHLAACDSHERAGDGVFSDHLLATLAKRPASYYALGEELCRSLSGATREPQNPQVRAYPANLGSLPVLGGLLA